MEATAKLRKLPISARKIGRLAALIRGKNVVRSLAILESKPQQAAVQLKKLLLSAISNWQNHYGIDLEEALIFIKSITVDRAGMFKRIMPAPRGVAHRIRKRSSHVVIVVDSIEHFATLPHEVASDTTT
ncbi:MAG: 50S ribosomal protein L22 [Candidatus Cardinium sp.]|uniref:50S ribosomal protein L22 n=1 Tax=Cardinium endosymbiont of Dermatophagoides farinae TaxID=2597823 RepID=UPI0011836B31|nr:50S ribosomal protein L22 [Cardinium endosymbiont of Dermatophagoides farinae]TSJ81207.1 50S ribosomal protein L22 [Cardinium endosymbiont of Dermatophagoides farinae]UWW97256.1 MAG: 50S ribosomal protein L22 [Candidatus Cardinium sp.]